MKPTQQTPKRSGLRVQYESETQIWFFWREPASKGCPACWSWTDHEGYRRNGPETWAMFVPYLRGYFESYAVIPLQDLN